MAVAVSTSGDLIAFGLSGMTSLSSNGSSGAVLICELSEQIRSGHNSSSNNNATVDISARRELSDASRDEDGDISWTWGVVQVLQPAEGTELGGFGRSLAIAGDVIAVGAYGADNDAEGGVFVYHKVSLQSGENVVYQWIFHSLLQASDNAPGSLFGECNKHHVYYVFVE